MDHRRGPSGWSLIRLQLAILGGPVQEPLNGKRDRVAVCAAAAPPGLQPSFRWPAHNRTRAALVCRHPCVLRTWRCLRGRQLYEEDGKFYAVITDGTDWFYRIKGAIRVGTAIEIPPDMLAAANDPYYIDHPNPTHHGVVFLEVSSLGGRIVNSDGGPPEQAKPICYFKPSGA